VVNGETVDLDAPGLRLIKRAGGRMEQRWVCSPDARQRGYLPRTVHLHFDLATAAGRTGIEVRCGILDKEMREWLNDPAAASALVYDGTVASLILCYQSDRQSPYFAVSQNTQRGYDDWCRTLNRGYGKRRIDRLRGQDFRRWYNEIAKPKEAGGAPRLRLAKAAIREMLMILLNYGAEMDFPKCLELAQALERMTLRPTPEMLEAWHASKRVRTTMTFANATAIVETALAKNLPLYRSLALGVAAQWEFTIAQIDVIGWWEKKKLLTVPAGAIYRLGQLWKPGLVYEDFIPGMVLDLSRNKTGVKATFDVTEYPLFMHALAAVPESERVGPVAVDGNGDPIRARRYIDLFREVATAAGVPETVWNMTARHGGGTEARASGATADDTADHMQKTDVAGMRRDYIAGNVETTRRVARSRVAGRAEQKKDKAG
jgi:hypothetical protein